jgi:hypothetical protein
MLVSAQSVDGGDELPSDELINQFRDDISEACTAEESLKVAEIAAGIYVIGRTTYGP